MIDSLITVVIPCKNEEQYIAKTLASLQSQLGICKLKVIVADADSTDNTINTIKHAQTQLDNLKIKIIKGGPVAIARNLGATQVKTPYVLFIDADTELLETDILQLAVSKLKNYDLVTCQLKSSVNRFKPKLLFKAFNFLRKYVIKHTFCTGVFFLTNVNDFISYGKFDETVTNSEDYLLSRHYPFQKFCILPRHVTQDDRRFDHMGYVSFLQMLVMNYINKNNIDHFRKNINYWKSNNE